MLHRHLNHQNLTPAAIDAVVQRGVLNDWLDLARAVRADPEGPAARALRQLCIARSRDPDAPRQSYAFWSSYLDTLDHEVVT